MLRSCCERIRLDGTIGTILLRSGGEGRAGVFGTEIGFSIGAFDLLGVRAGSLSFAAFPRTGSSGLIIDAIVLGMSTVDSKTPEGPVL